MGSNTLRRLLWNPAVTADKYWPIMTSGDKFYRAVEEAVRTRTIGDALDRLDHWEKYAADRGELDKLEVLRALVWCGREAERPDAKEVYGGALGGAQFAISPYQPFAASWEQWAWVCVRTLIAAKLAAQPEGITSTRLDPGTQSFRNVSVPVALVDGKKAFIATLELEVLPDGAGAIAHHPRDVFLTTADADFRASMADAWRAAGILLGWRTLADFGCDSRWRLLADKKPVPRVLDRSASGAAARGWWFALSGKIPDEGILVMAEIVPPPPSGAVWVPELKEVEKVKEKLAAIAALWRQETNLFHRPDTIVVAGPKNKGEAEEALKILQEQKLIERNAIRVGTPDELRPKRSG